MTREIPLTQGRVAIVDDEDFERVRQHTWCLHQCGKHLYATTNIERKTIRLHRFILGLGPARSGNDRVDHWDGDGLNNVRSNLRPANRSQNAANNKTTTRHSQYGFKGIGYDKREKQDGSPKSRPWSAHIKVDQQAIYLGVYPTAELAARAYDAAARHYFGEYANVNFPQPPWRDCVPTC